MISIHALREEGDSASLHGPLQPCSIFLSTPSARRATDSGYKTALKLRFLSTPSARRATWQLYHRTEEAYISIHALREEGDMQSYVHAIANGKFLSTPSARRATARQDRECCGGRYFYPRPPRGGRQTIITAFATKEVISIHALREEGDSEGCAPGAWQFEFLSTPSARRATLSWWRALFSPRKFLSTPSARRATLLCDEVRDFKNHFYPRPPRGGRLVGRCRPRLANTISIHALREEGDCLPPLRTSRSRYFYPRPPRGGRPRTTAPSG